MHVDNTGHIIISIITKLTTMSYLGGNAMFIGDMIVFQCAQYLALVLMGV